MRDPNRLATLMVNLRKLFEGAEPEDAGDLLREIMRWLKRDADVAGHFANRVAKAMKDSKLPERTSGDLNQVWDVLSNLAELLGVSFSVARDAMQATAIGEGKSRSGNALEVVRSLGRWLKGAKPAVSAYSAKVNTSGRSSVSPDNQEDYDRVMALLHDLQRIVQDLDPLVQKLTVLDA